MEPHEQNVAIAEACGWLQIENTHTMMMGGLWKGYPPKGAIIGEKAVIPDYWYSLDEMHKAEKLLTENQFFLYVGWIAKIQDRIEDGNFLNSKCVHATSTQRAEAFLRTLGLWQEQ